MHVLLIVASAWDEPARALAHRWGDNAALLTPLDLSREGWRWQPDATARNMVVTQRQLLDPSRITGVFTRLPSVSGKELPQIIAGDRDYVAAEMHAFLFAWLSQLPRRVVNRPSAYCLAGPNWRHEQWIQTAARLAIEVEPARRTIMLGTRTPFCEATLQDVTAITIAGDSHTGSDDRVLVGQAYQLVATAGVSFATILFRRADGTHKFAGVNLWPDITNPVITDLLLRTFQE